MCPTFTFWYKKEIIADSLHQANKEKAKYPIKLDSISVKTDEKDQLTSAIGFEYHPSDED